MLIRSRKHVLRCRAERSPLFRERLSSPLRASLLHLAQAHNLKRHATPSQAQRIPKNSWPITGRTISLAPLLACTNPCSFPSPPHQDQLTLQEPDDLQFSQTGASGRTQMPKRCPTGLRSHTPFSPLCSSISRHRSYALVPQQAYSSIRGHLTRTYTLEASDTTVNTAVSSTWKCW